jgi:hypothetical protein
MTRRTLLPAIAALFLIPSLAACNLQLASPVGNADLAVTQTLAALATQVGATLLSGPSAVPSDTPTPPETPTETPTPPPTETPTALTPTARLNQDTHCRSGPGLVYHSDYTGVAGTEFVIVGRTTVPEYVIVNVPGAPGRTCWLWTRYAEVFGDLSTLPLSTPPPTPTPNLQFKLTYSYLEGCVGWDPGMKVVNTGDVTFRSARITAHDTVTDTTESDSTDVFDKRSGCAVGESIPKLDPGQTGYVYANSFLYDPTGNEMEVTVKLCTETGLGGQCVTKSTTFTP